MGSPRLLQAVVHEARLGTVGVSFGPAGASYRSQVFPFECNDLTVVAISKWRVQGDHTEIVNNLQVQSVAPLSWCAFPFQQNTRKEWHLLCSSRLCFLFNNLSVTYSCEVTHLVFFCVSVVLAATCCEGLS